jgi:flagellar motor switch protein FliG
MATSYFHKAAVVLLSLPESQAARLLLELPSEQAAAVRREMAKLGRLDQEERRAIVEEFAAGAAALAGTREKVVQFQSLRNLKADVLLDLLADERPQTVALVLSHLPPRQAGEVLDALPPERQASVFRRLAALEPPSPAVLRDLEQAVGLAIARIRARPALRGMAGVVKMLHTMEPAAERHLLEEVAQADPALHHQIRCAMFGADVAACCQFGSETGVSEPA